MKIVWQNACPIVFNIIMIDDFALLFNCTTVVRFSDLMPAFLLIGW